MNSIMFDTFVKLSAENSQWIKDFQVKHGRNPRVLHIGNIANNAYNNAKILNSVGIDSDVICYDYYHIMGCPEWEDADFDATNLDHFRPDWTTINLGGFKRQHWFAQGSQELCLKYLIAKLTGDKKRAKFLWIQLGCANGTVRLRDINSFALIFVSWANQVKRILKIFLREDPMLVVWKKMGVLAVRYGAFGFIGMAILAPIIIIALGLVASLRRIVLTFKIRWRAKNVANNFDFENEVTKQVRKFAELFPERADKLVDSELTSYKSTLENWSKLFANYDIVQGYSTDGIYPLLANIPYFAFEHGTIRDIPYNATPQGRLTALTYRCASHVFVTNFDCRQSAEFLASARYTLINHPYDEDHGMKVDRWEELQLELKAELESNFLFFFPTRQDWVTGTGYADKANDVFLKAFCQLRAEGYSVGLVCCSWGANVSESHELIKELGCDRFVRWVGPMAIVPFERMAKACGCVVDQFMLGAFGGVLFKAMSVGVPVLTYLDEQRLKEQYEEVPPVINCRTEAEIAGSMRKLIDNPEILISKGQESRAWIKKFHGKSETINAQVNQYRLLISA